MIKQTLKDHKETSRKYKMTRNRKLKRQKL